METAQDAPLTLMGVVIFCGCILWVWPWYLMAIWMSQSDDSTKTKYHTPIFSSCQWHKEVHDDQQPDAFTEPASDDAFNSWWSATS